MGELRGGGVGGELVTKGKSSAVAIPTLSNLLDKEWASVRRRHLPGLTWEDMRRLPLSKACGLVIFALILNRIPL